MEVGFHDTVGYCSSTDEGLILLNGQCEFGTLYVEDGMTRVSESDGCFEEVPVNASGGQHGYNSNKGRDIVAVDQDGGPRLKGMNSLKSGVDLLGLCYWPSRVSYLYLEPLSHLSFLLSVMGVDPLGVSTFTWGCVTDMREKESPPTYLRPEGRGHVSCPRLWVFGTPSFAKALVARNSRFRDRGFYYVRAYIPHAFSVL
ncbi:hypothetical protein CRG98_011363 [Punica granatum]|uniref:Uncharacterized protein n=1 Tax=Punica granatum TaxID=22663 RepID=A0A2I0KI84_PUNGR|nr:hypothetical protein CRG98_011363 [Punica granatum]